MREEDREEEAGRETGADWEEEAGNEA